MERMAAILRAAISPPATSPSSDEGDRQVRRTPVDREEAARPDEAAQARDAGRGLTLGGVSPPRLASARQRRRHRRRLGRGGRLGSHRPSSGHPQ